ncbi:lipoprotein-releasing ABC transporter ATP-binding protein LolD [Ningiella sp. W23]|uniref:lipoprotein-releasing ABC transporter ATP-binding protein LolD n=1 Tax=Ningiella sp. W23 TaxID=3023715 RepID=UPI0037576ECE
MDLPLLRCQGISKSYRDANTSIDILQNVSIEVKQQETLAILGSSGSGKSTLLHILGTLDSPDSGSVYFNDTCLNQLSAKKQAAFRNTHLGFVYQFHHLLPEFSAQENVAMPLLISNTNKTKAFNRASQLLERVGLADRMTHKPSQLSGGERQRVAIARALVNEPDIIMADEPTGNLDSSTSEQIFELIRDINQQQQTAFVIVTHDQQLAKKLDRTLALQNGQLETQ